MYIYNVTTNVSEKVAEDWLHWMQKVFIPAMLESKKLSNALLTQVQVDEEMGGLTYSTQYFCESEAVLQAFLAKDLEHILNTHTKFSGQFVEFSTQLKIVNKL